MTKFKGIAFSMDEETLALLRLVAEKETDTGDFVNESRTIRKLIRDRAASLGIVTTTEPPKTAPKRKAAA